MKRFQKDILMFLVIIPASVSYLSTAGFCLAPRLINSETARLDKQLRNFQKRQRKVEAEGIDTDALKNKLDYFYLEDNHVKVDPIIFEPTGVVLGKPFEKELNSSLFEMQKKVQYFFAPYLKKDNKFKQVFYPVDSEIFHSTLISYEHYSRLDKQQGRLPEEFFEVVADIVAEYRPIKVTYKGLIVMPDGAVLAKGFFEDDQYFALTGDLSESILEERKSRGMIYVNLGRLLQTVDRKTIKKFHEIYAEYPIGSIELKEVTMHDNTKFSLKGNFIHTEHTIHQAA